MKKPVKAAIFLVSELKVTREREDDQDNKPTLAKLNKAKSASGTRHGEQEFTGWHLQAPALMGGTTAPGTFTGRACGGQGRPRPVPETKKYMS